MSRPRSRAAPAGGGLNHWGPRRNRGVAANLASLGGLGGMFGLEISTALVSHTEFMIFGALIVFFLIVEPHGLARLWSIGKEKLRLWPFPH